MKLLTKLKNLFISQNTKSKTSPVGGNRGCLCDDDTYSKECCNGELLHQGIGRESDQSNAIVTNTNEPRTITNTRG
jgi:hypothetical protein